MKTFADNAGRTWAVAINVAAVKRVKDLLGVNLLEIADQKGSLLERLVDDPCLLCDILFCLVKPEAEAKGITDEEFGRALGGDCLDAATDALLTEIADFFPKGRREILRRVVGKLRTLEEKATRLAITKLDDPKLDAELEQQMTEAMGAATARPPRPSSGIAAAGNLPGSVESIPGYEP